MAEIEVLLDFGTPYVRLDDYNAMKERYWRQTGLTQTADDEAAKWKEHARAALARAEAAEALARRNNDDAATAEAKALGLEFENERLAARVAELKAEAARLQYDLDRQLYRADARAAHVAELEAQLAAQQWRPVTEKWPHYAERVAIGHVAGNWAAIATRVQSPDDDEWELEDGKVLDWESASVAIELPPLPQEPPQ